LSLTNQIALCENLCKEGQYDLALKKIQKYVKKNKNDEKGFLVAAIYAKFAKRKKISESYFKKALQINPQNPDILLNYGVFLIEINQLHEAEKILENLYLSNINSENIFLKYSQLLSLLGKVEEAIVVLEKALLCFKENIQFKYMLGIQYLAKERYVPGWNYFHYRINFYGKQLFSLGEINFNEVTRYKIWNGEVLTNKKILIIPEQGFGDVIMCLRFVKYLKIKYECFTTLLCHAPLENLLKDSMICDELVVVDNAKKIMDSNFDFWVSAFDLPRLLHTGKDFLNSYTDIYQIKETNKFKHLFNDEKFNIGFVWRGKKNHDYDAFRSIQDSKILIELVKLEDFNFISLLNEISPNELDPIKKFIKNGSSCIDDFSDIAAIIRKVDLIITVDTAIAHLAGSMNIPTWLMINKIGADWRWGINQTRSLWYPSVEILRVEKNDWITMIQSVKVKLLEAFNL